MQIRFWGTRGSIPKPGPLTLRYGGNTSCVEVRSSTGTLVVLDCGTGAHALGQALSEEGKPISGHILISHTHWDHIQGVPFFAPLFGMGNTWDIYAPRGLSQTLRDTLAGQMQYTYFPVGLEELGAAIRYHDLVEGRFELGDISVVARYLNHPALTLGYRLECNGIALVYATDHEPYSPISVDGSLPLSEQDRRHAEFFAGADLLIHDAQYLASEFPAKRGWGHSSLEYVLAVARQANVRRVALFHHDPLRDDAALDGLVENARRLVAGTTIEVFAAAEGEVVTLDRCRDEGWRSPVTEAALTTPALRAVAGQLIILATSDPATIGVLSQAARADGIRCTVVPDAESAIRAAKSTWPALVLAELSSDAASSLAQSLRERATEAGQEPPQVVVVAAQEQAGSACALAEDCLVKPFSTTYARSRIRGWLMRGACRWRPAPLPAQEDARLAALERTNLLDSEAEASFDRLTRIAAALFDVPIALVSLVDRDRQWFKSAYGLATRETPREAAFCAHAILEHEVMIVPDALLDDRFADSPLVTGAPRIRFYAGAPLALEPGLRLGTLCVMDHRPRDVDQREVRVLRELADQVEELFANRVQRGTAA